MTNADWDSPESLELSPVASVLISEMPEFASDPSEVTASLSS